MSAVTQQIVRPDMPTVLRYRHVEGGWEIHYSDGTKAFLRHVDIINLSDIFYSIKKLK